MSDIVERLRYLGGCSWQPELFFEAANEIERLRKDAMAYANVALSEENDRLIEEIERLRAELKECEGALDKAGLSRLR
jgi:hypothetical protein